MAYQKPSKGAPRTSTGLHRNAAFFGDLVDVVGHFKSGRKPPPGGSAFDRRGPMVFIENKTGANLKLGEAVELGDYLLDEEDPYKWWLEGNAVSTTFGLRYAIAAEPIETDAIGAAWVRGPAVIRYTGSAPSSGDGMGPKPSQETLEPGFPCFAIVDDVIDTTEKLLLGTLGEVRAVFGKPQADIAAATDSTTPSTGTVIVQYFDGTEYQASTFEMEGTNYLEYKLKAGRLYKWIAVGDQWHAVELGSRTWKATIASPMSAGGSGTVTLSDGTSVTGENVSGQDLEAGTVLATDDAYTGNMLICGSAEPGEGGGGSGIAAYRAVLTATLSAQSIVAAISTITAFDGGGAPSISVVNNWFDKAGYIGDEVIFVPSPGLGGTNYTIIDVSRPDVAHVIEGWVYDAFTKSSVSFRGKILRAYQGSMPVGGGIFNATLMVLNFDREGILPQADAKPYLFEGETGAAFRAEYDPDFSKFLGIHIYRATWVECPEESPVEAAGSGEFGGSSESHGEIPQTITNAFYFGG